MQNFPQLVQDCAAECKADGLSSLQFASFLAQTVMSSGRTNGNDLDLTEFISSNGVKRAAEAYKLLNLN